MRWGGALVLGGFLSRDFLLVLLLISAHQLLYEWVIKLKAGRHPIVFHVFLCFNLPLRVISGFLCFFDISNSVIAAGADDHAVCVLFAVLVFAE